MRYLALFLLLLAGTTQAATLRGTVSSGQETTNSASITLTFPSDIVDGNGVVAAVAIDDDSNSLTWPAGWTVFKSETGISSTLTEFARYEADGTEDSTTFDVTITGTTQKGAWFVFAVDDWDGSTTPSVSTTQTAAGTSVDPDSLTPGSTEDYMYVSVWMANDQPGAVTTFPTGYTDTGSEVLVVSGGGSLAWAFKETTSSTSDDPSVFEWTTSETAGALTFAIAPNATTCDLTQAETANLNTEPTDALQNCSETPVGIFIGPYHFDAKVGSDTDDIIFDLPPQDELTTNYPSMVVGSGSTAVLNTSNSCPQDFTDGSMADECDLSSYFARDGQQCGDGDSGIECVGENLATNKNNLTLDSPTTRGSTTITYASGQANGVGGTGATLISDLGNGKGVNDVYDAVTITTTANQNLGLSFYLLKGSSTGTLIFENSSSSSYGQWTIDLSLVGSDWERITKNHAAVTVGSNFTAYTSGAFGWFYYSTDAALKTFHVSGMQVEESESHNPSQYSGESGAIALLTSDGLHSVGSYTDLLDNSDLNDGDWSPAGVTQSRAASFTSVPFLATELTESSGGSVHYILESQGAGVFADSENHTCSVYAKQGSGDINLDILIRTKDDVTGFATFDLETREALDTTDPELVGWSITELLDGEARYSATVNLNTGGTAPYCMFRMVSGTSSSYSGDGTSSILLANADWTESSFVLPPVDTAGSTVTADSAIVGPVDLSAVASGWSDPVNGISGHAIISFMRDYDQDTGNFFRLFGLGDGTSAETLEVVAHSSAARFILFKDTNSVTPDASTTDGEHNWTAGESISVAFRASSAGIKLWVTSESGQTIDENTTANAQADFQAGISQFYIGTGGDGSGGGDFFKIECFVPYDKAVPDAVLANLGRSSCGY